MNHQKVLTLIPNIILAVEQRLPEFLAQEEDRNNIDGICALCLIDDTGGIHGKLFGRDKIRLRNSFRLAWIKASQVWITGLKTGEFEKQVYSGALDDATFGIIRPEFIGWEGGQRLKLTGIPDCPPASAASVAPATWP